MSAQRHDPVGIPSPAVAMVPGSAAAASPTPVAIVREAAASVLDVALMLTRAGMIPAGEPLALGRAGEVSRAARAVILLADLDRPESLAALRTLQRAVPLAPVVALSPAESPVLARRAINAGAVAFVPETLAPHALVPAVMAAVAGLVCVPQRSRRLVAQPTFSHREREVLQLMLAGLTNREIADRLHLAESTAKGHLVTAFSKLGVRSRKEAAATLLDPAERLLAFALPPHDRGPVIDARERSSVRAASPHPPHRTGTAASITSR